MTHRTTVPGTRHIPMVNGRGWELTQQDITYQIANLNGSNVVRLSYRHDGETGWTFGHERPTNGQPAHVIARQIRENIVAPVGMNDARSWLTHSGGVGFDDMRGMSSEDVMTEVDRRYPGGWDAFLRSVGAT